MEFSGTNNFLVSCSGLYLPMFLDRQKKQVELVAVCVQRNREQQILHVVVFFFYFEEHESTLIQGLSVVSKCYVILHKY